jgi:hypothetical protein
VTRGSLRGAKLDVQIGGSADRFACTELLYDDVPVMTSDGPRDLRTYGRRRAYAVRI